MHKHSSLFNKQWLEVSKTSHSNTKHNSLLSSSKQTNSKLKFLKFSRIKCKISSKWSHKACKISKLLNNNLSSRWWLDKCLLKCHSNTLSSNKCKFSSKTSKISRCRLISKRWTTNLCFSSFKLQLAKASSYLKPKEMSLKTTGSRNCGMPSGKSNLGLAYKVSHKELFSNRYSKTNKLEASKCSRCCRDRLESCKLSMASSRCLSKCRLRFKFYSNSNRITHSSCINNSSRCTLYNQMLGRTILLMAEEIHPQALTPVQVSEFLLPNIFVQMKTTMLKTNQELKKEWWCLAREACKVEKAWTTRQLTSPRCGRTACITNDVIPFFMISLHRVSYWALIQFSLKFNVTHFIFASNI